MKRTKIIVSIIFMLISIMLCTTNVQAVMQSRPDEESAKKRSDIFFKEIRNMESTCLGKTMNLDTTSYLDTSGNGVDVHMAKNTEWGTVALLAASAYGEAPTGQSDASTTGNATGVYQMADGTWEYVAGIYNTSKIVASYIKPKDSRYYDLYEGASTSYARTGDATVCVNWKGASERSFVSSSDCIFKRGGGALFGYGSDYGQYAYGSRACLVVGAGL